jgi:hypothetical protein
MSYEEGSSGPNGDPNSYADNEVHRNKSSIKDDGDSSGASFAIIGLLIGLAVTGAILFELIISN